MRQIEFDYLITPGGTSYNLHDRKTRFLLGGISGQGLPPIEYITQRGPFQDGETVKGYRLGSRVLQMVHRRNGRDRYDYWNFRSELLDIVRPNQTASPTPCVLRKVLPNGNIRDLEVYIQEGPNFGSDADRWDEYSIQEALRFIAYDPTFYDPDENLTSLAVTGTSHLVYPASYPVRYGVSGVLDETFQINYQGSYKTYPIIEIDGPMENPTFTNQTTGEVITLEYFVPNGITVTIDLRYGEKTVIDDDVPSNDLIGTVSDDSDLATFHIAPPPVAANGVNTIRAEGSNSSVLAAVRFRFLTRFIGI